MNCVGVDVSKGKSMIAIMRPIPSHHQDGWAVPGDGPVARFGLWGGFLGFVRRTEIVYFKELHR